MPHRSVLHRAAIGACALAVAGAGLLALPAHATGTRSPATATAVRMPRAEAQVVDFYQQYLDAVREEHSEGKNPLAVREYFLTPEADDALTVWGSEHQVDPVLRRSELPKGYKTATQGEDADNHSTILVTAVWEDGAPDALTLYKVQLDTMLIDSITDAPA
ncbi:hypothetical protein ACIQ9P_12445 [Kitasatospora sp. NPDC094019]|uniref:hypothetical protein n=1 Tax=Kitasatospora sp. NPDC094019 TaxID=3364091 RepID=UPI003804489F